MTHPLRIGPYEAGEFVAGDAHASVYRVVDPEDGRALTAKLYTPTGGPDASLLSRWHKEFADEVKRLQRHGRDLVSIEATGRAIDLAWVVMNVPAGEFLVGILGEQPVPTDTARAILGSMASALDRLHTAGLVHRSLKPSNVVIAGDGSVFFMDTLLLGRFAEAVLAGSMPLGRVRCAAPEVVLGYRQRPASNQYSLAVMACRALTGAWPYAAGNAIDYAYACVYQDALAPSSLRAGIPPEVDAIIGRALAKEPDDRYPTCTAFVDELDAVLQQCEPSNEGERVAARPAEEVAPEWLGPASAVLELVAEPLPQAPPPLGPVRERQGLHEPVSSLPTAEGVNLDKREFRAESLADEPSASTSRAADPEDIERAPGGRVEPREVVLPDAHEFEELVAAPMNLPVRRSVGRGLRGLGVGILKVLGMLVARARGRRISAHFMREACLADWRSNAARSNSALPEWPGSITPEWSFTVTPAKPGWLRVDGRYAGPAPAEISISGPAGKRVLVELMRDGVAVAETELKLHPLMETTWEPQEDS